MNQNPASFHCVNKLDLVTVLAFTPKDRGGKVAYLIEIVFNVKP